MNDMEEMEPSKSYNHAAYLRMLATLNNISGLKEQWLIKSKEQVF
jgi:hypothetical protein